MVLEPRRSWQVCRGLKEKRGSQEDPGDWMACVAFANVSVCVQVCFLEVLETTGHWFSVSVVLHLYLFGWRVTVTKVPLSIWAWGCVISKASLGKS